MGQGGTGLDGDEGAEGHPGDWETGPLRPLV